MGITIKNLKFAYGTVPVLKGLDFSFEEGKMVCVLGKNGAGKSTLFRCILGLQKVYEGEIYIDGVDVKKMSAAELAKKVAYIPQNHSSTYAFTVRDMVLLGTTASMGRFENPGKLQHEMAQQAIQRIGIEKLADRSYTEISGGEQQLTLIARALAQQAKILIMDEPCANLDYGNQIRLLQTLIKLGKEGYLILQSTHNPEHAFLFADEALALNNGRIAGIGRPQEILTKELLEDMYKIEMELYTVGKEGMRVCVPKKVEVNQDDERII